MVGHTIGPACNSESGLNWIGEFAMAMTREKNLVLASASPRRASLMREYGYHFVVVESPIQEPDEMGPDVPPIQQAEALSYFKARSVKPLVHDGIIVAADTIAANEREVFGKPIDRGDARRILTALMGTEHRVITGLTLLDAATDQREILHEVTIVRMRQMGDDDLDRYLNSGAWNGKAGAYGIQDHGDAFIEHIEGSYTNVVGLPMELLARKLAEWGYVHSEFSSATVDEPGS
jgi:MAF protein